MRMTARIVRVVLVGLSFCLSSSAQITSMKLLTPQVGWAANGQSLFWTADGGTHWKDITPQTTVKEVISSVFFLDASTGWVLLAHGDQDDRAIFDLASTTDSGANWHTGHVAIPDLKKRQYILRGQGDIDFVDQSHGWMSLDVESSANSRIGILLATKDGGTSWAWPPDSPGVAGRIHFADARNGWLAGGPGDEHVYVTHDGSKTWQELLLKAPAEVSLAHQASYDSPPVCSDSVHCFLPVTYSAPERSGSALVLFVSQDGGQSWTPSSIVAGLKEISPSQVFASAMAGSTWVVISTPGGRPALTTVESGTHPNTLRPDVSVPDSPFLRSSFANRACAWIFSEGKLLSTLDGGMSWVDVTPPLRPSEAPMRGTPPRTRPSSEPKADNQKSSGSACAEPEMMLV